MTIALAQVSASQIVLPPVCRVTLSARHGIWCLVSARHWEWISEYRWNYGWHRGTRWKYYAKRNTGPARSTVYLHREIMIRNDPRTEIFQWTHVVHHGDGQSLNCTDENLAWLEPGQNSRIRVPRAKIPSLESIICTRLVGAPLELIHAGIARARDGEPIEPYEEMPF